MKRLALAGCLLLAGCDTMPVVRVPVPVPCIAHDQKPKTPALLTDAELAALDDYRLPLALYRDRLQRTAYIGELEAAVEGCARLPTAPLAAR